MKIELEIPKGIIEHCKKLNIPEENIPKVFETYVKDKLGYFVDLTDSDFRFWTEDDDNICDFVSDTKEYWLEAKMMIKVTMSKDADVDEAVKEISQNIRESDLLSKNGCIIDGYLDEYIVENIKK